MGGGKTVRVRDVLVVWTDGGCVRRHGGLHREQDGIVYRYLESRRANVQVGYVARSRGLEPEAGPPVPSSSRPHFRQRSAHVERLERRPMSGRTSGAAGRARLAGLGQNVGARPLIATPISTTPPRARPRR